MGGGTSLSSHRAGFGVFWSKALSKSTAESAFADSVNCNDYESCHCEVPEARRHIGLWSNASSHCEERSDVAIAKPVKRNNNAITTSNAAHSPRNDNTVVSLRATERSVAIAKPIKCDSKRKKAAFTLAEVLITLAIIGIVAALTIPTLVQNYQERAWNTASQVFQRKLGEALRVMNVQGTLAGYTTTEAFVDELSKHIKITRICDNDDITTCFSDTVTWGDEEVDMSKIKKAKNFGDDKVGWGTNTIGVQFANGVNGVIAYNPSCTQDPFRNDVISIGENGIGTDCLAILYDVDGFKNPNTNQKDLRGLNVELSDPCAIELSDGTCFSEPFHPTPLTTAECDQLVADGYPINKCITYNDYWAGAVKKCYDMGYRLPNDNDLRKLAMEIYQDVNGNFSDNRYSDKAYEMGLISSVSTLTFWLWTNEEDSSINTNAIYRVFHYKETYRLSAGRYDGRSQAVCVVN